jgi:hypothetical protein
VRWRLGLVRGFARRCLVGQGGDVTGVHMIRMIGDGGQDAANYFAAARFGHVGNNVVGFGASDFADHRLVCRCDLVLNLFGRQIARL